MGFLQIDGLFRCFFINLKKIFYDVTLSFSSLKEEQTIINKKIGVRLMVPICQNATMDVTLSLQKRYIYRKILYKNNKKILGERITLMQTFHKKDKTK